MLHARPRSSAGHRGEARASSSHKPPAAPLPPAAAAATAAEGGGPCSTSGREEQDASFRPAGTRSQQQLAARRRQLLLLAAPTGLAAAAALRAPPGAAAAAAAAAQPATAGGCELQASSSGLRWCDLSVGAGALPIPGAFTKVHYTAKLASSGVEFDSSYKRKQPLIFKVGERELIRAIDVAVLGAEDIPPMRDGGKRLVVAPPGPLQQMGVKSLTWITGMLDALEDVGELSPEGTPTSDLVFEIELLPKRRSG